MTILTRFSCLVSCSNFNFWVAHLVVIVGLDEGEQDSSDPASIQGAYLSFLHLRHLRVRDLKRTVCMHRTIMFLINSISGS